MNISLKLLKKLHLKMFICGALINSIAQADISSQVIVTCKNTDGSTYGMAFPGEEDMDALGCLLNAINHGFSKKAIIGIDMTGDQIKEIPQAAFADFKNLIWFTISSSVTSIGVSAFEDCESLTEITIPSSVTSIGDFAFASCESLTEITIPSSVTSIGEYAFASCLNLPEITIPKGVTSIGNSAFEGCRSLTQINNHSNIPVALP